MGGNVKKYFKKEFQLRMCSLDHEDPSDFCITCWQRNRSVWPLLVIRTLIMIGCVSTVISSFVIMIQDQMGAGHWFIFMTHWGLIMNTVASLLAFGISLTELLRGEDSTPPMLVKCYWLFYNIAITIAFFITIFYWSLLTDVVEGDYAMDPVLDVFIHGINSVLMFCLLVTSRHPHRLMHFYIPLLFGIIYMIFSIIYYFAGGLSPFGTNWIYPMLDWSKPGETVLMVLGTAILIILIHMIVAAMTVSRDALTKRYRETTVIPISNGQSNGMSSNYLR
uniref:Protein rolling stone n=1 Tax=Heliothis virescens TaxID=7102 RepID=A0A2A4JVE8_HELVI